MVECYFGLYEGEFKHINGFPPTHAFNIIQMLDFTCDLIALDVDEVLKYLIINNMFLSIGEAKN